MSDLAELYEVFDSDPSPLVGFVKWIAESRGIQAPKVLDVGCGPGRLLGEFNRLGWSAVGLEPERTYFRAAAKRAAQWPDVLVLEGGFAEIPTEGEFDLAVAMNGPFSYLLTPAEREQAGRRLSGALKPGGLVVLDLANFPWILKNYRAPTYARRAAEGLTVTRFPLHSLDFHSCVWTHRDLYVVEEGGKTDTVEQTHRMSMIGYPEVARVLQLNGFEEIRTYNGYESRSPEELSGSRLLVTARKPHE